MKRNKGLIATLIFGFISFIFVIGDFLALHDIYKESGEYDVSGEWAFLALSFIPIVVFHALFVIYVVVPFFNRDVLFTKNRRKTNKGKQVAKESIGGTE